MSHGPAIIANKRNHFLSNIRVELRFDVAAMKGVRAFVVKAGGIHGIDAEEFHAPRIDQRRESPDQSLPFEFPLVARAGGKPEQRRPPVTVDHYSHFKTEALRIPAMIFPFHFAPAGEFSGGFAEPFKRRAVLYGVCERRKEETMHGEFRV